MLLKETNENMLSKYHGMFVLVGLAPYCLMKDSVSDILIIA